MFNKPRHSKPFTKSKGSLSCSHRHTTASILSQINRVHTHYISFKINLHINIPSTPMSLKWPFAFRFSNKFYRSISALLLHDTHIHWPYTYTHFQLLTIIIFSKEYKLWKFLSHFLNLLNISEDLYLQQQCCVNLKSHSVESFQDHLTGCYHEGWGHLKPISFTWHAPLSYDKIVTKNTTYFTGFVLWCKSTNSKACWTKWVERLTVGHF